MRALYGAPPETGTLFHYIKFTKKYPEIVQRGLKF